MHQMHKTSVQPEKTQQFQDKCHMKNGVTTKHLAYVHFREIFFIDMSYDAIVTLLFSTIDYR